jgi:hypothetical protein
MAIDNKDDLKYLKDWINSAVFLKICDHIQNQARMSYNARKKHISFQFLSFLLIMVW